jgi:hypothetical protein
VKKLLEDERAQVPQRRIASASALGVVSDDGLYGSGSGSGGRTPERSAGMDRKLAVNSHFHGPPFARADVSHHSRRMASGSTRTVFQRASAFNSATSAAASTVPRPLARS